MEITDINIESIRPADWNPNYMEPDTKKCLRRSIERFSLVVPLVVRRIEEDIYEAIGGAMRLDALKELGASTVPCVIVDANDVEARLLSQALNHLAGKDDPGLRAQVVKTICKSLSIEQVLEVLPDSATYLMSLLSIRQETIAQRLEAWQHAQKAKLKHLSFQLLPEQLRVVERALRKTLPKVRTLKGKSPNLRGTALFLVCQKYLGEGDE